MKVNWTQEVPKAPGTYYWYDEAAELVRVLHVRIWPIGLVAAVGGDMVNIDTLRGPWAPAELPDPPEE